MNYREGTFYKTLEEIITEAGVKIEYGPVHDDAIDGPIWARSDQNAQAILMPEDPDAFPNEETACLILGHEMGHLMSDLDSPDYPPELRLINEKTCDLIGAYLYRLSVMTAENRAEQRFSH